MAQADFHLNSKILSSCLRQFTLIIILLLFILCYLTAKSCLTLCDLMTAAHQAPLSVRFPRQEYCSGLPFPPPGDLPNLRTEPASPALAGRLFTTEPPGKPTMLYFGKILQKYIL